MAFQNLDLVFSKLDLDLKIEIVHNLYTKLRVKKYFFITHFFCDRHWATRKDRYHFV